jgi:tetratricopeptide (TPR) repeat protein
MRFKKRRPLFTRVRTVGANRGSADCDTLQTVGGLSLLPVRRLFFGGLIATPLMLGAAWGARQANDVEAIHILEAARDELPGHYLLEYYFGLLASRLGREQEAILALEKAAQLEPNSPDPFYELGKLYGAQQNWPQARQALEHVIELNPKSSPAHYQLSRVYAHLGLNSRAEQEARQTHTLVDAQRDQALRKQRERAASFQPETPATLSHLP